MKTPVTTAELGERVQYFRKKLDYTQDVFAQLLGMSRSALVQVEKGKRKLSVEELFKLSFYVNISLNELLSPETNLSSIALDFQTVEEGETPCRIDTPMFNVDKFKNVLLYILEKCGGRANIGETALYKLLYFADFDYYEKHEEQMTGASYRKLPKGPVPYEAMDVFNAMVSSGDLRRTVVDYFGYKQKKLLPQSGPNLKCLNGEELAVIDSVIERYANKNATELSELSHRDVPWVASNDDEVIGYELAFYREFPFSVRTYPDATDGV